MGETGTEAGGVGLMAPISLEERLAVVKIGIDRGAEEIALYDIVPGPDIGLGAVVCDHWGRMYWHRPELRKLTKIYDPTESRTNRVDTAVVRQLNKSMNSNRNLKMAIRELRAKLTPANGDPALDAIGQELDEILRMS
ncbi:MAG TPA: hypothetical protein VK577_03655 [Bradyrhizobium sp.]|nr:hypothetical protein [Bradyrhizobium sp.]